MIPTDMTPPRGFVCATTNIGVKDHLDDLAIVYSTVPATSAAVFTRSTFAGPSVSISREACRAYSSRGIVVIARNANVATGQKGEQNAYEVRERAARLASLRPEEMIVASTGVIGEPYPMDKVRNAFSAFRRDAPMGTFEDVARAIMTTDTHPKLSRRSVGRASVVGVGKGVGMIEPNMATMLAFIFTDAAIPEADLDRIFRKVVGTTFNALSVDTDTSTSDTAAIIANGLAGPVDLAEFEMAVHAVALDLVKMMARDGEGASKLITVSVSGARNNAEAKSVAKSVVNSPLVKTSVHGADPNWGRVAMAIGKCEIDGINPRRVRIAYGDIGMHPDLPSPEMLDEARSYLAGREVTLKIDLGMGDASFEAYGCDLTEGYIRINADYTS